MDVRYLSALSLLERLNIRIHLDYDDELIIDSPELITQFDVTEAVSTYADEFKRLLKVRRTHRLAQFVGGPENGKQHWYINVGFHGFSMGRARWAVYEITEQAGRAFFRGYATSKKNMKLGVIAEQPDSSDID